MICQKQKKQLESFLQTIPQMDYSHQSRIHSLKSFSPFSCYIKRDDELGFGVSGSKIRKYRSILPFLKRKNIRNAVLIGSAHSNHILGLSQLLIENEIRPILFLKESFRDSLQGNFLFTRLLVDQNAIHWVAAGEWKNVEDKALQYVNDHPQAFVIKEGGSIAEALPGALSLPLDIIRNEEETDLHFDHFLIDSGTGLMACAVILGWHWMQKATRVHVLLLAEDESYFLKQLENYRKEFELLMQTPISFPKNFVTYKPEQAKSFGSTHPSQFRDIIQMARQEGFFIDPIYMSKLFTKLRALLLESALSGNVLVNHSGGAQTLMGFQAQLSAGMTDGTDNRTIGQ